jgi:uncharacterized protein (TIGR00297 family)
VILRVLLGTAAAVIAATVAWRTGALSRSGAAAAVGTGAAAVMAGLGWGLLLVGFFVAGTALSHLGARTKSARTAGTVDKSGARDARQVLANGGVFAIAAPLATALDAPLAAACALGALAAALADTAATEIGTWIGGRPRSVVTGTPVAPGMSGGITVAGSTAGIIGAAAFAAAATALLPPPAIAAVWMGGVVGLFTDSLLGATVQERRWCPSCATITEQRRHVCGDRSQVVGGIAGMDNDVVNAATTLLAGITAALAWSVGQPG